MDDRGQALPLVVGVVAVIAVLVLALGSVAGHAVDAARARTAADAAALAGVMAGTDEAARAARRNGGVVIGYQRLEHGDVLVRVRVGTSSASARATVDEVTPGSPAARSP